MPPEIPLFAEGDLRPTLEGVRAKMVAAIDACPSNTILNTADDTLAEHFANQHEVAPLALGNPDDASVEVVPTKVDARGLPDRAVWDHARPIPVDGTLVRLRIPFTGDPILFRLKGSSWAPDPPHALVQDTHVTFERTWGGTPSDSDVTRWVHEEQARLRRHAGFQQDDIAQHNEVLRKEALGRIRQRRAHLLAAQNLQANLPFKMHPRPDAPLTFAPDGVRKRPPIRPPRLPTVETPFRPEPSLTEEQFGDILRTLRAMGQSLERNPAPYANLGEEDLRSILLTALNAQFEGGATGETFSVLGKTDILVRQDDRVLFIGECKIWDGSKTLSEGITQALGYLAWRDSHATIVLFVRRKAFAAVAARIPEILASHPQFIRHLEALAEGEWRCRAKQTTDPTREVTLTVIAFHLPI